MSSFNHMQLNATSLAVQTILYHQPQDMLRCYAEPHTKLGGEKSCCWLQLEAVSSMSARHKASCEYNGRHIPQNNMDTSICVQRDAKHVASFAAPCKDVEFAVGQLQKPCKSLDDLETFGSKWETIDPWRGTNNILCMCSSNVLCIYICETSCLPFFYYLSRHY